MTTTPFRIGFLLYPGLTQLDLTGPAQVLGRMSGAEAHLVWKDKEPVRSDGVVSIVPTTRMAECPPLDLLCVPGGYGCVAMMNDDEVLAWLRRQAAGARLVTSVCTGSLVLGAAGLLTGYRAGCHWAWGEQLSRFGAEFVRERVVVDRDRITGGGVTAGIDFAFRVVAELRGRDEAEASQLVLEYDPQPLAGGTPATARPEVLERLAPVMQQRLAERMAGVDQAAQRYARESAARNSSK